jgi:hypothetical protein
MWSLYFLKPDMLLLIDGVLDPQFKFSSEFVPENKYFLF